MEVMDMIFDAVSYVMGHVKGMADGADRVVIQGEITCVDDGDGNITITTEEEAVTDG